MPDSWNLGVMAPDMGSEPNGNGNGNGPVRPQQKKRRRPALACEQCRRRKIRCDRNVPCNHCVKSNITSCSYAPTHIPASWAKKSQHQQAKELTPPGRDRITSTSSPPPFILPAPSGDAPSGEPLPRHQELLQPRESIGDSKHPYSVQDHRPSHPSSAAGSVSNASNNVDWLVARVHHLEEKLSKVVTISNNDPTDHESSQGTDSSQPIQGTVSKTRYFGRTHWMNGPALLSVEMRLLNRAESDKGDLSNLLVRCKALGRTIKEKRFYPLSTAEIGKKIPTRHLADQLVEAYLRTFEGVLRILHIPTFRAEYEGYWQTPEAVSDFFTIQLQLVMALGAVFHDATFSLKAMASQWVYEAQLWLVLPTEKRRMTISGIQIMCLLSLARSACSVGQDLVWITTGGLVRKAMYMGLHRDPRHLGDMTTYRAEMRRRLWATILELNLQSSFDAGGPPLISSADYDVQPPADLDDEQLGDELDSERVVGNSPEAVTQMSIPLALFRTLPLRLSLLRYANDFRAQDSYDETLRYNSKLTKACRLMSQSQTIFVKNQEGKSNPKATEFHTSMSELLLYRCFHTLHQPVISKSLSDPRFYFSRKMYLDGALKITHICGLSGPRRESGPGSSASLDSDLYRLIVNASGVFRNIPVQSLPSIAIELLHKGGDQSLGLGYLPAVQDYDLRATLDAGLEWSLRRIRSGETNIKGHCVVAAAVRHIDAAEAGLDQAGIEGEVLKGAEESAARCLEALKDLAAREGLLTEENDGDDPQMMTMMPEGVDDMAVDFMGDWGWDDMNGLLWGSPMPFEDVHPPIFG